MDCQMRVNDAARYGLSANAAPLRRRLRQAERCRDLLVAHANGCNLYNGVRFLCDKDHVPRKILANTWDLKKMRLWRMDWCHESVMCVDVRCGKNLRLCNTLSDGSMFFIKMGTKLKKFILVLRTPSPYDDSWKKETFDAQNKEKGANNARGPVPAAHLVWLL